MDEKTLELFNNSYESCVRQRGFLERFYEIFLDSSPEVQDKFKATNMEKQIRIMEKSLLLLTMASLRTRDADEEIARLGERHGPQGMRIGAHLYDLWLDALVQTVSEFDPRWSEAVGESWRKMFTPFIAKLKSYSLSIEDQKV